MDKSEHLRRIFYEGECTWSDFEELVPGTGDIYQEILTLVSQHGYALESLSRDWFRLVRGEEAER